MQMPSEETPWTRCQVGLVVLEVYCLVAAGWQLCERQACNGLDLHMPVCHVLVSGIPVFRRKAQPELNEMGLLWQFSGA
jgi:hypothetical protein